MVLRATKLFYGLVGVYVLLSQFGRLGDYSHYANASIFFGIGFFWLLPFVLALVAKEEMPTFLRYEPGALDKVPLVVLILFTMGYLALVGFMFWAGVRLYSL